MSGRSSSDSDFERDPRRQQELRMRPAADEIYASVFGLNVQVERTEYEDGAILDKHFAIDVRVTLPASGMILLGQEKFLSPRYASFGTVTIEYWQNPEIQEQGDWFKLASQVYFVGYATPDWQGFDPWILLNWPSVVLATEAGAIPWQANHNKDGHARASFRFCKMRLFPPECLIASSLSRTELS